MPQLLPVIVTAVIVAILVTLGVVELLAHKRVLARLPVRIHVNGTRGKTSVVRLIAAGLRSGGMRVCSKTTGSFAAITGPDGEDYPLHRPDPPNIIEQMRVLRHMAAFDPDVAVIECMALQPPFQALTERQMVISSHSVITNARADHLDIMGPNPEDVALALAGSTPYGAKLFTAERKHTATLRMACRDRDTALHPVTDGDVAEITDDDLAKFAYAEHAENVALALAVCADLGVARADALAGMQALQPEVGATRIQELEFFGRSLLFVNAFAANDPESTGLIWERVVGHYGAGRRLLAVVNCRFDRPQRSQQLAEVAAGWSRQPDHYVLMGSGTLLFARAAVRHGIPANRMTVTEGVGHLQVVEVVLEHCPGDALIVGMCNVHGGGAELARHFTNRSIRSRPL